MVNAKISSSTPFAIFRILVGLMFLQHGLQKIFGLLGGNAVDLSLTNLMFYAGIIELIGGILITLGLFTRITASISALEMLGAFIMGHVMKETIVLIPIINRGELALMFFAAFLVLAAHGPGKWSLDKALAK